MSDCRHAKTLDLRTRCYRGSVSDDVHTEANPAAHGCVTVDVECASCGARRAENRNGWHVEVSAWGESRAERQAAVAAAQEALSRMPRPKPLTLHRNDETVTVSVDDDGLLIVDDARVAESVVASLPAQFVGAAQGYRRAVLALQEAAAKESRF